MNNFCEVIWKEAGYWAARRSTLSTAMIKHSFIAIAYLASLTPRERNDGRPEEAHTAHSLGEEGSMRQLATHTPHSPNAKIIQTTKTSGHQNPENPRGPGPQQTTGTLLWISMGSCTA